MRAAGNHPPPQFTLQFLFHRHNPAELGFNRASLRRRFAAIDLPLAMENPANNFAGNLRDFTPAGVAIETADKRLKQETAK
jgi:hypothetical protein